MGLDAQSDRIPIVPRDERTTQLEALNEVARIATLDLELRPMLQRITDTLAAKFGWEFVALTTIDRDYDRFVCEAVTSAAATEIRVGYTRSLGSGVVGEVASSGEPIVIDDVRQHANYIDTMPEARSEICVPIKHQDRIVAILNVESTRPAAFHGQMSLLLTMADQIAGAIACGEMYEELGERARLMQMMSELSRTALEGIDLTELLNRSVQYMHVRFPLEIASVLMYDRATNELVQTASIGECTMANGARLALTSGIVGRCFRTGERQLVHDVATDDDYIAVNPRVSSELSLPIRFHGEIVGVMNLESASPEVFNRTTVAAFQAFADQISGAIHLASMNEQLTETGRLLQQRTHDLEEANGRLASMIETLQRISSQDGLTGVSNRRHFDETLLAEWRRALRRQSPVSLLMLDIDYFKSFNDHAGHQAGDVCLRRVADTLAKSVTRAADLVSRYGGEEFAVLLPETGSDAAERVANGLRDKIEAMRISHPAAPSGVLTVSIGVATSIPPRENNGPEILVRRADSALYDAKRSGRNCVRVSA